MSLELELFLPGCREIRERTLAGPQQGQEQVSSSSGTDAGGSVVDSGGSVVVLPVNEIPNLKDEYQAHESSTPSPSYTDLYYSHPHMVILLYTTHTFP